MCIGQEETSIPSAKLVQLKKMMSASLNQTPYHCISNLFNPHKTLEMQPQNNEPVQAMNNTAANLNADPNLDLTYLNFLEQKISQLRSIISFDTNHQLPQQQQLVTTELNCIIFQLISISKNLLPCTPALAKNDQENKDSSSPDVHETTDSDHIEELEIDDDEEHDLLSGSYEVLQIEKEDILASHTHFCSVCGKGFKRDANLRMHMRGHGDEYKTASALAKPGKDYFSSSNGIKKRYSCPFVGCKRNKEHKSFQPLKTALCVKNHYKRSHCDKSYTCSRCHVKKFSVVADLRTHEKHCGRDKWVCSCGTTFSRRDKLFGHVAVFEGHTPAIPPEEDSSDSSNLLFSSTEQVKKSLSVFDDDDDVKGVVCINDMVDGRGNFSPMGLDSFSFDGFDLFEDF